MKYGVVTFHRAINFGAVLQTLALQDVLKQRGIESEVIDYRSNFIEKHYEGFKLKDMINLRKIARILLKNAFAKNNHEHFYRFSKKYISISDKAYFETEELKSDASQYAAFIVGSDQVWNYISAGFDKTYFLDFVDKSEKKLSYAASFGVENIPEIYKAEYRELLSSFNKISTREQQGKKIIKKLLGKEVPVVLDPTLLLTKNEWTSYMDIVNNSEDYVLVYLISETKSILKFAKEIGKRTNTKVIYINDRFYKRMGMKNKAKISPSEWLSLFYGAKYVVTNSFHGIAFSINFKKELFVELLPEPAKVNSRIQNTLDMFGLSNRIISKNKSFENYKKINYLEVDMKLNSEREKSLNYIDSLKRL